MYDKILQEDIHEDHRHLASRVLRWLAVSIEPLTIEEYSELCTISPDSKLGNATALEHDRLTPEQLLNLLPNLVTVEHREGWNYLTFMHFSVREYIIGPQPPQHSSANSKTQCEDVHRLVAKDCLAYLYLLPERELAEREFAGSLVYYAITNWQLHLVATGEPDERTRKNAFFLSASIQSKSLSALNGELPEEFVQATQWLKDPDRIRRLIPMLERWTRRFGETDAIAVLHPKAGQDPTIICTVLSCFDFEDLPSFEAVLYQKDTVKGDIRKSGFPSADSDCDEQVVDAGESFDHCSEQGSQFTQKISVNGNIIDVPDYVFRILWRLRQGLETMRPIWMEPLCVNLKNEGLQDQDHWRFDDDDASWAD